MYDSLGRETAEKNGSTTETSYIFDTDRVGYLTSSTRQTGGGNYTTSFSGYNTQGLPASKSVVIPAAAGPGINGTYTTGYTWTSTGLLATETLPGKGDLPAEKIHYRYTNLGNPVGQTGMNVYAADTVYSPYGEVNQITMGVNVQTGWQTINRDPHTHRVTNLALDIQTFFPVVRPHAEDEWRSSPLIFSAFSMCRLGSRRVATATVTFHNTIPAIAVPIPAPPHSAAAAGRWPLISDG